MHKSFKYLAMTALASALIAGQATTAFAFKNDTNNGPGAAKTNEVSLQAPSDTSDNSQASGNNDPRLPLQKILPSLQAIPSLKLPRPQKTLLTPQQKTQLQQKLLRKTLLPRFRPIRHFYRYSFFVLLIQHGAIRSMMTLFFL